MMSDSYLPDSNHDVSTATNHVTANDSNNPSDGDISSSSKILKEAQSLSVHDQQMTFDKIERERRTGELHEGYGSPPPSYGESTAPTMQFSNPVSISGLGKPPSFYDTEWSYTFTPPASYHKLLLKNLGFQTKRQLGFYLDPEQASVPNWKHLADEMGFSNLHVSMLSIIIT